MNYTRWYAKNGKFQKHEMWLQDNLLLETIMGSHAYACERADSDHDVVAIVMPKQEHIYPAEYGFILGFDQIPKFEHKEFKGEKQRQVINNRPIEIEWVSLIDFFNRAGLKGSPNLVEVLFAEKTLVTVGTNIGYTLRDNRKLFLSLQTFNAFKGYAFGQLHRIRSKEGVSIDRNAVIAKYGYDIKMASHVLRLLDNLDQILVQQDLDLRRNKEECKAMKKGEWGSIEKLEEEFAKRMSNIEDKARKSPLSPRPRIEELHNLLMQCIESCYGSASKANKETEYISAKDVHGKLEEILATLKETR